MGVGGFLLPAAALGIPLLGSTSTAAMQIAFGALGAALGPLAGVALLELVRHVYRWSREG